MIRGIQQVSTVARNQLRSQTYCRRLNRRATENPISAPPRTSTTITTRMNFPTPARKPRASNSAASKPTWVTVRIMTTDGKASRLVALPHAGGDALRAGVGDLLHAGEVVASHTWNQVCR